MNEQIPFCKVDLCPTMSGQSEGLENAIINGMVGPGEKVAACEAWLIDHFGVEDAAIVNSGTTALTLAVERLAEDGKPHFGFFPAYGVTSNAMSFAMSGPNFMSICVGVDPRTALVSPEKLEKILDLSASAHRFGGSRFVVSYVAFNGNIDIDHFNDCLAVATKAGAAIIFDGACCGLQCPETVRSVAELADGFVLSFSAQKHLTAGQGGAVLGSKKLVADIRRNADLGLNRLTGLCVDYGGNFRMSDIQAAVLLPQMEHCARIASRLKETRDAFGDLPLLQSKCPPGLTLFNILLCADANEAENLIDICDAKGIDARRNYVRHDQHPLFKTGDGGLEDDAIAFHDRAVYLPFGTGLTPDDAVRIQDVVKSSGVELLGVPS